jgi:hypothetical protein
MSAYPSIFNLYKLLLSTIAFEFISNKNTLIYAGKKKKKK